MRVIDDYQASTLGDQLSKSLPVNLVIRERQLVRYYGAAAEFYYASIGSFPETLEDLTGPDSIVSIERPRDPWGKYYGYEVRNGRPFAYCLGKDGIEGGEGENQDYVYPDSKDE